MESTELPVELLAVGAFALVVVGLAVYAAVLAPRRRAGKLAKHLEEDGWLPVPHPPAAFDHLREMALESQPSFEGEHVQKDPVGQRLVAIRESFDATVERAFEHRTHRTLAAVAKMRTQRSSRTVEGVPGGSPSKRWSFGDHLWFGAEEPVHVEGLELAYCYMMESIRTLMGMLGDAGAGNVLPAALGRLDYKGTGEGLPPALATLVRERRGDLEKLTATLTVGPGGWLLSIPTAQAVRRPELATDLAAAVHQAARA